MKKFILLILFLFFSFASFSQSKEEVYAGIILHIMKYVEWQSYKDRPMQIGIINDTKLVSALNIAVEGKSIHFKNVLVKKISGIAGVEDIDVLFIHNNSISLLPEVIPIATQKNILVITETKSKIHQGAAINFIEQEGKLRFELYMSVIEKCGFKVSEQLKRYAVLKT